MSRVSTRLPEKMSSDRDALDALLDSTVLAHVAYVDDAGAPGVLPTAAVRWGDRLLVHGSTGSRWMRLASQDRVTVSIAAVDGVVVARSAFESSVLYRSAVLFGRFSRLAGTELADALDVITERLIPGRRVELRASTAKELAATMVLAMPIDDWSLRISDGWPDDTPADVEGPAWAGRIRFGERELTAEPAPDLEEGIEVPDSVNRFTWAH